MIEIIYHGEKKDIELEADKSVLEMVRDNFEGYFSPCAKSGSCGRCRCKISNAAGGQEGLTYESLACQTRPEEGMRILCDFDEVTTDREILSATNGLHNSKVIAVDIGTTTLVFKCGDRTYTCLNPQRKFGSDVVSRILASSSGHLLEQKLLIRQVFATGLERVDKEHKAKQVVVAGNTTMQHLFMGYDCSGLGEYPFKAYSLSTAPFEFQGYKIYFISGISAFVGGDILAGLFHIEADLERKYNCFLLLDIGTNGELVLKKGDRYYCTSTAAGPAFEGDATAQIPGTDMLHMLAEGLRRGIIDKNGLMLPEYFESGYCFENGYILTQKAVRDIQLAKAAIYCGIKELLQAAKVELDEVEVVFLAGGFGYFMDPKDAFQIRLLPSELSQRITAIGNSALAGAISYGKHGLQDRELKSILDRCESINLSSLEGFGNDYIEALNF